MNKLRTRSAILLAAIILATFAVAPAITAEEAAESDTHAGVVVSFDEETIEYHLIEVPDDEMSGFDLLEETGYELEVEVFEGMGEAVCSIGDTGCPSSDCFCDSYYWQFSMHDGTQWVPQMEGAGELTAEPGELHAWAWTDDSPELPDITFGELIELADNDSGMTLEEDNDSESDDGALTQILPFIAVLAVLFAIVAWVGIRRYRSANRS